jgi:hypothetical protein
MDLAKRPNHHICLSKLLDEFVSWSLNQVHYPSDNSDRTATFRGPERVRRLSKKSSFTDFSERADWVSGSDNVLQRQGRKSKTHAWQGSETSKIFNNGHFARCDESRFA